jgi:hypothetical protein
MDIFPAKANYTGKPLFGKSTKAVNIMSAQELSESLTALLKHFNVHPSVMYSVF